MQATSQRSNSPTTSSTCSRFATTSIRSWLSESMTSYGLIPDSRRGTCSRSSTAPESPRAQHSSTELVSPAAPRSCSPTIQSRCSEASSWQASISIFSRNGLPTCTAGRISSKRASGSVRLASPLAPWMPSRPVSAPTSSSALPLPLAFALRMPSARTSPTHIAFTSGFPLYDSPNMTSPPTVGIPRQFPYPPMPPTTPSNR